MKSYESSTATLRAILAHPLLQREKIDETMDAMASANADAKEIDDTIRIGTEIAQGEAGVDDIELEEELNKMIQEAADEKAQLEKEQEEELRRKLEILSLPSNAVESIPPEQTEGRIGEAA